MAADDGFENISHGDIGTLTISGRWERDGGNIFFVFGDKASIHVMKNWEPNLPFVEAFTSRRPIPPEDTTKMILDDDRDLWEYDSLVKMWYCRTDQTLENATWADLWTLYGPLRVVIVGSSA